VYSGTPTNAEDAAYFSSFHTSAEQLGEIAAKAKPKLLVVWHYVPLRDTNEAKMVEAIHQTFHGAIVVANDLDVISP
ncbi:MAG: hypothetical protein WBG29_14095, partial [Candidatus Acidiferrales bacterium]